MDKIPADVLGYLRDAASNLRDGRIERLRLCPLTLAQPLDTLIARRVRLFDEAQQEAVKWGTRIAFSRRLKRSRRTLNGTFDLLRVSDDLAVIASSLGSDEHLAGPQRLVDRAYPIARRPFFSTRTLIRLIEHMAERRGWTAVSRDATGYHRRSHRLRRDMAEQAPSEAAREMAEQGRQLHATLVSFRGQKQREMLRVKFDRNAAISVRCGDPTLAFHDLMLAGIAQSLLVDDAYRVTTVPVVEEQDVVELVFPNAPFQEFDTMRGLCKAIRQTDGLNVSIVHLNPYLQAQVLDFFTGAAVELVVVDQRRVSLIPRSANCTAAMRRIATSVFQNFGEATATRVRMADNG